MKTKTPKKIFLFEGKLEDFAEIKTRSQARQFVIDWQEWQTHECLSWGELISWQSFFILLAKKFKLTKEFKQNGII